MKRLLVYLNGYKKECVLAPLFKMLEASFELMVPLIIAAIIDNGIEHRDKPYIIMMCLVLLGLGVIGLITSITAQYYSAKAAVGFATKLRHSLFEHLMNLSFTEIDKVGTSTMITRLTSDVNQAQNGVNMVLRLFLRSPFVVFGAMIMAFTIDVKVAMIFVVAIILLSIVVFTLMAVNIPMVKRVQQNLERVLEKTRENLTGVRVIRAFGIEKSEKQEYATCNTLLTTNLIRSGKISALMNPLTYIIINAAVVWLVWVGALRVDDGILSQGQVVALYSYMTQILAELIKLANLIVLVNKSIASGNRIATVFDLTSSMTDGNKVWEDYTKQDEIIKFRNVSLTYQNSAEESLSEINFAVLKGETIGIIGGTGSGKSSLVHLIPRFYDATKGDVLLNGKNIKEYRSKVLQHKIAVVMQKAVLFQGDIETNLRWGKQDASEKEMKDAIDAAQASNVVEAKGGLQGLISQGGKNLSGGQRQRLAIARALVKKPEILILDDSSSALDYATDAALRKAIKELPNKITVFIVSQRTSSIQYADKIIVLDDGRMVGFGTHANLLGTCETYREIHVSQYKDSSIKNSQTRKSGVVTASGGEIV